MTTEARVVIVSNDVVPGSEMPVAAPGLRAFGLAQGLSLHGVETEVIVVSGPVDRQWQGEVPPPTRPGTVILPANRLREYIDARRPLIVILSNSNQIDHIDTGPGVTLILDFFAPKLLEFTYRDEELQVESLRTLRERKIRAIESADAFIVNGAKKVPYFLAWILQTDRDLRRTDLGVVPMAMPGFFADRTPKSPLRLINAGYLQGWSQHGRWVEILKRVLDGGGLELHVMAPQHWGRPMDRHSPEVVRDLISHPAVKEHKALRFEEFQQFLAGADVSIDLFDWNWEREYAMVTRTVVALACGVPVVHPPFTEVSPVIEEYDAGWLVDPQDERRLESTLIALREDADHVAEKALNARKAWENVFEPAAATTDLVRIIEGLGSR